MDLADIHSIARSAEPLRLDGVHATRLATLLEMLDQWNVDPQTRVFADLSLGAWRSHQVAYEFCTQLGLILPLFTQFDQPSSEIDLLALYAPSIGKYVDAEHHSDRTTLSALELATQVLVAISNGVSRTFLVIAPGNSSFWERENLLFIQFLTQGLRDTTSRLLLVCVDAQNFVVPHNWIINWLNEPRPLEHLHTRGGLFRLIPGIVDPDVALALKAEDELEETACLLLEGGCIFVAPEYRQQSADLLYLEYNHLAVVGQQFGWLKAYAQFYGSARVVEPVFLCAQAWQSMLQGSYGIALRLLKRGLACVRSVDEQAICQAYAQGLYIVLQRFQELAEMPDPAPDLSQELRAIMLQTKGWGLERLDDVRAQVYLREAQELLATRKHTRTYLYLLNILALSRLKSGDQRGALAFWEEIEACQAAQSHQDWQVVYVACINVARMQRRRGDFAEAERYYLRAFATTRGVRSASDAIYSNVCLARLHGLCGRNAEALLGWIHACLHWVSCNAPEALAPKVVTAIAGRELAPEENVPEVVSGALLAQLWEVAQAAKVKLDHIVLEECDTDPPVFICLDQIPQEMIPTMISSVIGEPGWCILAGRVTVPSPFTGPMHLHLRCLLHSLLKAMSLSIELNGLETIIIDDYFGCEIPGTIFEALEMCVRLKIPKLIFGGECIELDQATWEHLERTLRVRLAHAVDKLEVIGSKRYATFKRYLESKDLSAEDARILSVLDDQPSLVELADRVQLRDDIDKVLNRVRSLERARIVKLYLF